MVAGYFTKQIKLYDMKSHAVMNKLVLRFFSRFCFLKISILPAWKLEINGRVFLFTVISVLLMFGLLFAVIPLIEKDNRRRGVLIQGIGRSNFVLLGCRWRKCSAAAIWRPRRFSSRS